MSDQTPPNPDEPGTTPDGEQPPVEPTVEPTAAEQAPEETTVIEPLATEETPAAEGEEPPPPVDPTYAAAAPPPAKSGRGKLIAIIAAVVVVVLVAGTLGFFFLLKSDAHKITTPSSAGRMDRDGTKEKALGTQLTQAEEQFQTQGEGKGSDISYVKSAVYNQADDKRGPKGALVFLGAKLRRSRAPASGSPTGSPSRRRPTGSPSPTSTRATAAARQCAPQ